LSKAFSLSGTETIPFFVLVGISSFFIIPPSLSSMA
jgi:hypothetical protein